MYRLAPDLEPYIEVASEVFLVKRMVIKGDRIIVPPNLKLEILEKVHAAHLGTTRCKARARECLWRPSIGIDNQW